MLPIFCKFTIFLKFVFQISDLLNFFFFNYQTDQQNILKMHLMSAYLKFPLSPISVLVKVHDAHIPHPARGPLHPPWPPAGNPVALILQSKNSFKKKLLPVGNSLCKFISRRLSIRLSALQLSAEFAQVYGNGVKQNFSI